MGHGHEVAHGLGETADPSGAAEFPPAPSERWITPAPEDFGSAPPASRLLWPLFWAALAVAAWLLLSSSGWPPEAGEHRRSPAPSHAVDR